MTSQRASNSRSSGRGRHRSTAPPQPDNPSREPSGPPPGSTPSPRKRRTKSPPPQITPTRLRQTIVMTAGAPVGILGQRSRKMTASPSPPESPFVNPHSPQDTPERPVVPSFHIALTTSTPSAPSAPVADTQGGSSMQSADVLIRGATPSSQDDRLTPTVFNTSSREASMPPGPITVNTAYGGGPPYYGNIQPQPSLAFSDPTYFNPPLPSSPNLAPAPLGAMEGPNPLQGPVLQSGATHNPGFHYGGPYGYYAMHGIGSPWPNFHVGPSYLNNTTPIPSVPNMAPEDTLTTTTSRRSTSIPPVPQPLPSQSLPKSHNDILEDTQVLSAPAHHSTLPPQEPGSIKMPDDPLPPLSPPPPIATLSSSPVTSAVQPSLNSSSLPQPSKSEDQVGEGDPNVDEGDLNVGEGDPNVGEGGPNVDEGDPIVGIQTSSLGGRPSNQALGVIAKAFQDINEIWADLSDMTGKTVTELRRRYEKSTKGGSEHRYWNTYLKYFSKNVEKESARLNRPYEKSQEFRSACYAQYKEDVPDWRKALDFIFEVEFSHEEKTVGQRKREYERFEKKFNDLLMEGSVLYGIEGIVVLSDSSVFSDSGLVSYIETPGAVGYLNDKMDITSDEFLAVFAAHIHNSKARESLAYRRKHEPTIPAPVAKAESPVPGPSLEVVNGLWLPHIKQKICAILKEQFGIAINMSQFPWKQLLLLLAKNAVIISNYPNILMPGEARTAAQKSKAIGDLTKAELLELATSLRLTGNAKYLMRFTKADRKDWEALEKGMKPIIISQPPALGSSHNCARQAYYNIETDRTIYKWDGPTREPREASEKRERFASEDPFKSMGTHITRSHKGHSAADDEDTIVISSSSPPPASSKRKARSPALSLEDSDYDSEPVASKKKKRNDPSMDNKGKKVIKSERGSGPKGRVTGKARVKSVAIVEDSETDELEKVSTPEAPSRPKPRPAFKRATGAPGNHSAPNATIPTPLPAATTATSPTPAIPLSLEPQLVPMTTKIEETQDAKSALLPLHGQPAPIAHHGLPPPHGLPYNHFPGYGYPPMGPQHHFAGGPVQGTYGGAYQTHHPAYPPYHPQGLYPQRFLQPPQADIGNRGGASTSRSTPQE